MIRLDPSRDYRFKFEGRGTQLSGAVYDPSSPVIQPLATVTAIDGTYAEGRNGLMVWATDQTHGSAVFDNFFVLVPEPSTSRLVAAGCCVLVLARALARRRPGFRQASPP